ncbi:MAG: hypothetical protein RBR69_03425 [Candidatus Cloacimonadaceae bacterium]|jgi:hypothetical protein|nr:hypothetical protein [Candidatus Cloacimonadota bacterium]MCB5254433.1 hypothetical protein [Candidatus Cloacimonadota bacterium]MCK9178107.1 hypothetical protein [Candidatus Cloacimonadota bacterium]MCK9241838.1 hypothetical protein [Candidatus Cloacimonadota bacterium]MDY0127168.1 hypothetical protein [Candidatus Cloacimonadaceae bacterium]
MKKGILILFSLLFVVTAFAFDQGTINLGGSASFESVKADSDADAESIISINPNVGYFVIDNLSADLNLGYIDYDGDVSTLSIGIGGRYFYRNLYGGLQFDYQSMSINSSDYTAMYITPKFGYVMPLAENVFIDLGLKYQMGVGDYGGDGSGSNESSVLQVGVGLQIFLSDLF